MRDLTKDELEEYFEFARSDRDPVDFSKEQAVLIGQVVQNNYLMGAAAAHLLGHLEDGVSPNDLVLSMWIWAFQMGRECESRLLTRALKGG